MKFFLRRCFFVQHKVKDICKIMVIKQSRVTCTKLILLFYNDKFIISLDQGFVFTGICPLEVTLKIRGILKNFFKFYSKFSN